MSEQSAIRMLQTAIENVREQCKSPDCKALLATLDTADSQAEKALGEPDDSAQDKKVAEQPKDLTSAADKAREQFAEKRKAAASN